MEQSPCCSCLSLVFSCASPCLALLTMPFGTSELLVSCLPSSLCWFVCVFFLLLASRFMSLRSACCHAACAGFPPPFLSSSLPRCAFQHSSGFALFARFGPECLVTAGFFRPTCCSNTVPGRLAGVFDSIGLVQNPPGRHGFKDSSLAQ